MIDPGMTGTFELKMPQELVSHSRRVGADARKSPEMKVEGFRSSWFSRLMEKLIGQD